MKIENNLSALIKSMLLIKTSPKKLGLGIHDKWDSLAHLRILLAVEKKFKIKFTMREMTKLQTFEEILNKIKKKNNI